MLNVELVGFADVELFNYELIDNSKFNIQHSKLRKAQHSTFLIQHSNYAKRQENSIGHNRLYSRL